MSYERDLRAAQRHSADNEAAKAEAKRRAQLSPDERRAEDDQRAATIAAANAAAKAQREAQKQAQRADLEAAETERRQQREVEAKEAAFRAWGGSRETFEAAWPAMYAQQQQQQLQEASRRQFAMVFNHF